MKKNQLPWAFLDEWKGKTFTGQWPTLPEMFRITAERYPDRPCFTDFVPERVTRTYTEALKNIERLANWLAVSGVTKGSHVAVSGKNSSEWATVYLATLFAGGTIIPIDYGLHEPEIAIGKDRNSDTGSCGGAGQKYLYPLCIYRKGRYSLV